VDFACKHMNTFGIKVFHPISTNEFEMQVPSNCSCCRTKQICTQALSAALLVIDVICGSIKRVSTTVDILKGKLLQTDPITTNFALRCKHDWTNGLPPLVFEVLVAEYEEPDLLICNKSHACARKNQRVLRLL
jgi:hypothetical protein